MSAKRVLWTYQECPVCEGFGIEFCMTCEDRCDHDQLCVRCKGNGEVPFKFQPIYFYGVLLNKPVRQIQMAGYSQMIEKYIWPTRAAAQKELDTYDERGNLR